MHGKPFGIPLIHHSNRCNTVILFQGVHGTKMIMGRYITADLHNADFGTVYYGLLVHNHIKVGTQLARTVQDQKYGQNVSGCIVAWPLSSNSLWFLSVIKLSVNQLYVPVCLLS
jgi:hypothetical protein